MKAHQVAKRPFTVHEMTSLLKGQPQTDVQGWQQINDHAAQRTRPNCSAIANFSSIQIAQDESSSALQAMQGAGTSGELSSLPTQVHFHPPSVAQLLSDLTRFFFVMSALHLQYTPGLIEELNSEVDALDAALLEFEQRLALSQGQHKEDL